MTELSGILDGGGCKLDSMLVWTSRPCTGEKIHPHVHHGRVTFNGYVATTVGMNAVTNEQCAPEHSPLATMCCADGIGSDPNQEAGGVPVAPPSPPGEHHHHHAAEAALNFFKNSTGVKLSLNGLGISVLIVLTVCMIGGWCFICFYRASHRAQKSSEAANSDTSQSMDDLARSIERAGVRAKHTKLREYREKSKDSLELTEAALGGENAESRRSSCEPTLTTTDNDTDALVGSTGDGTLKPSSKEKGVLGKTRRVLPKPSYAWDDEDLPAEKTMDHQSSAAAFDTSRI